MKTSQIMCTSKVSTDSCFKKLKIKTNTFAKVFCSALAAKMF